MNYITTSVIVSLVIAFILYVRMARKAFKILNEYNMALQLAGQKAWNDLYDLKEKYRLITAINTLIKVPTKLSKKS